MRQLWKQADQQIPKGWKQESSLCKNQFSLQVVAYFAFIMQRPAQSCTENILTFLLNYGILAETMYCVLWGNNDCEVLHLFLQSLRLLPLTTCSVFRNLAHGPTAVFPLKIPLIMTPPPSSLHIQLRGIFCIVFTGLGFDTSFGCGGIWCYAPACILGLSIFRY